MPDETQQQPAVAPSPPAPLTQEERNDLRKRVLEGYKLSIEDAQRVCETLRQGQGAMVLLKESKPKRSKKQSMSDAELNSSLDSALGL